MFFYRLRRMGADSRNFPLRVAPRLNTQIKNSVFSGSVLKKPIKLSKLSFCQTKSLRIRFFGAYGKPPEKKAFFGGLSFFNLSLFTKESCVYTHKIIGIISFSWLFQSSSILLIFSSSSDFFVVLV